MAPLKALDAVKQLPKVQDIADLQAWVDCLLKENEELRAQIEEGKAQRKELEELKDWVKAIEEELKSAGRTGIRLWSWPENSTPSWGIWATSSTRLGYITKAQANQGRHRRPRLSGAWWITAPK